MVYLFRIAGRLSPVYADAEQPLKNIEGLLAGPRTMEEGLKLKDDYQHEIETWNRIGVQMPQEEIEEDLEIVQS